MKKIALIIALVIGVALVATPQNAKAAGGEQQDPCAFRWDVLLDHLLASNGEMPNGCSVIVPSTTVTFTGADVRGVTLNHYSYGIHRTEAELAHFYTDEGVEVTVKTWGTSHPWFQKTLRWQTFARDEDTIFVADGVSIGWSKDAYGRLMDLTLEFHITSVRSDSYKAMFGLE